MEEVLMIVLLVVGGILVVLPTGQLKRRKKIQEMSKRTYWRLVLMYLLGAGMIVGGVLIGGI